MGGHLVVSLEGQKELFRRGSSITCVAAGPYFAAAVFLVPASSGLLDEEDERRAGRSEVSKLKSFEMLGKRLEALLVHSALLGGVQEEVWVHLQDKLSVDVLPLLMLLVAHVAAGAHARAARPEGEGDDTL